VKLNNIGSILGSIIITVYKRNLNLYLNRSIHLKTNMLFVFLLKFYLIGSYTFSFKYTFQYHQKLNSKVSSIIDYYPSNSQIILNANPITSEGSNYGKYTNEEDAFLWFDEALFYVRAGSGGAGSNAVKFGAGRQHKYPTGGNGGNGGNVYLVADSNVNTLLGFRGASHFRAENGIDGALEFSNGRLGKDLYVSVPKGIVVKDNETDIVIGELNYPGEKLLVAKGGLGGRGRWYHNQGIIFEYFYNTNFNSSV
jgi:hypothetical protein